MTGHWFPAYVGLGSNLQEPARQLEKTFALFNDIAKTRLIKRSALYRSAPFGGIEQADFVNAAVALMTRLTAQELLSELQRIENDRGRVRGDVQWGPRILDLDLLVYANKKIDEPGLTVPHPGIAVRNFVLLPLREVAPGLNIPGLGQIENIDVNFSDPAISRFG